MAYLVLSTDTKEEFIFEAYLTEQEALERYNQIANRRPDIPLICMGNNNPESDGINTVLAVQNMK